MLNILGFIASCSGVRGGFLDDNNLDYFLLKEKKDLCTIKQKREYIIIISSCSKGVFKRYPYLYFKLFLERAFKRQNIEVRGVFFLYPSHESPVIFMPVKKDIHFFVETVFYHRNKNMLKHFIKIMFLKFFGVLFCKYPLMLSVKKEQ